MTNKTFTVSDLMELVRFEFRRFGFRAEGMKIKTNNCDKYLDIEFEVEPCTGQAAFSQDKVITHFRVWGDFSDSINIMERPIPATEENRILISIGVSYDHHSIGSNGITRQYEVVLSMFNAPKLKPQ